MKQELINALQTHEALLMQQLSKPDTKGDDIDNHFLYQELINTQNERKSLQLQTAKN